MPQTMTFTKFDHTISFDIPLYDEAVPNAREYAYFYGWRQSLQDAYANAKTPAEMQGDCQKKFDKIVSGNLKFRFDGQAPRKSDLDEMIERIASAEINVIAAKRGDKLTRAAFAEKLAFRIETSRERLVELAERKIAEELATAEALLDGAVDVDYDT